MDNYGWCCPVCLRVYSPNTSSCEYCNSHARKVMHSTINNYIDITSTPVFASTVTDINKALDTFLREPAFEAELWGKPL